MRRVTWTGPAIADLEDIDDYWSRFSIDAAERVAFRIQTAADFLATMPEAGPVVLTTEARKWRVSKTDYSLVYRVTPTCIEVLRIFHARQDWMPN